ncbi:copper-transporting ATPase PAA1, chloroplastic isoform X2 [Eucalyptus grandis]|uniref:copper-transporting ATPase PAA1, chloroplastic isoform X2 n=1 Tax=Eucalyptus grandis TaxID=71139 RepID=UPI00192EFEF4|nr:copper-transporting ATPase PAA1, chloroplastic isoform X2 [Eucalyptus grandis]
MGRRNRSWMEPRRPQGRHLRCHNSRRRRNDSWGMCRSVKRIWENQPQVPAASVNLTAETAVIWPLFEAEAVHNWQKELGETVAKHLTNCGFKSNLKVAGWI